MNKINKSSLVIIILFIIILGGLYYLSKIEKQKDTENMIRSNAFELDMQCAKQAKIFFDNYSKDPTQFTDYYENHYNNKLSKCFITIYTNGIEEDNLFIDLFDAVEGKHYASYIGHNNCSQSMLILENNPRKCFLDAGFIWLNGNEASTPDFTTSGNGNENTKTEFTDKIKSLMND